MMLLTGFGRRGGFDLKPAYCAAFVILSGAVAGCSADVTRFDSASFNLNDPPETTSAVPVPSESVGANADFNNPVTRSHPAGPYGAGASTIGGGVETAILPDVAPAPGTQVAAAVAPAAARAAYKPAAVPPAPAPTADIAKGDVIEVVSGDTLYGLSRRHGVSLAELMSVNGLTSPNLMPGQRLYLPSGATAAQSAAWTPSADYSHAKAPETPSAASPEMAEKYTATYTVKPGDSLYRIARAHKIQYTELQRVNGIADPLKVLPGTVLRVPALYPMTAAADPAPSASMTTSAVDVSPAPAAVNPAPAVSAPSVPETSAQPTIINSGRTAAAGGVAPKGDRMALAAPQAAAEAKQAVDATRLRWPAQGKIIAGFGGRPDGTHNDGINLSVPLGTEVHAAEAGVIAYAGSELKGYGNLVLVRHDNGWVTAYAHNEEMLVKRGDRVSRGQIIAKAGKTGAVDQPQVHFELRQNSRPVDPTPFMERL